MPNHMHKCEQTTIQLNRDKQKKEKKQKHKKKSSHGTHHRHKEANFGEENSTTYFI